MGWFGSLDLAYKYAIILGSLFTIVIIAGVIKVYFNKRRLKKYTKKAEEDATIEGGERVELNQRELDEGDLFGVRAIQSGYFGGVAQSRPSSIAEDRSDRDSMASHTLLGSNQSPDRKGPSPMSSVLTLPLEARTSSPLRHTVISSAAPDRPHTANRHNLNPIKSSLQPSDAQISGSVTHDPAVNMLLNVPPSPGATSRRSSGFDMRSENSSDGSPESEETPERRPESPSFSQNPNSQYGGHYIPTAAPTLPASSEYRNSARPVSTNPSTDQDPQSQHASVVSSNYSTRDSNITVRDNNRSSIQEENDFTTRTVKPQNNSTGRVRSSIQEEEDFTVRPASRPISTYRPYPVRTSSYDNLPPVPSGNSPPRNNGVQPTNPYHTSHLSDASSVYSTAHRQSLVPQPLSRR